MSEKESDVSLLKMRKCLVAQMLTGMTHILKLPHFTSVDKWIRCMIFTAVLMKS